MRYCQHEIVRNAERFYLDQFPLILEIHFLSNAWLETARLQYDTHIVDSDEFLCH